MRGLLICQQPGFSVLFSVLWLLKASWIPLHGWFFSLLKSLVIAICRNMAVWYVMLSVLWSSVWTRTNISCFIHFNGSYSVNVSWVCYISTFSSHSHHRHKRDCCSRTGGDFSLYTLGTKCLRASFLNIAICFKTEKDSIHNISNYMSISLYRISTYVSKN